MSQRHQYRTGTGVSKVQQPPVGNSARNVLEKGRRSSRAVLMERLRFALTADSYPSDLAEIDLQDR
jgi:hypothetical protein